MPFASQLAIALLRLLAIAGADHSSASSFQVSNKLPGGAVLSRSGRRQIFSHLWVVLNEEAKPLTTPFKVGARAGIELAR